MSSANKAAIVAVIGSSGSGKSLWVKSQLAAQLVQLPALVWDPMREYGALGQVCGTLAGLVAALAKKSHAVLVYQPDKGRELERQFNTFCGIAIAFKNLSLVVEELSFVTKSGYSPARWLEVVTTGRHYGLTVIGTTQRPALVDKTFFGNATVIRVGRLNFKADKAVMADALDVPASDLAALRPLDWIAKDMHSGQIARETLGAPKSKRKKGASLSS